MTDQRMLDEEVSRWADSGLEAKSARSGWLWPTSIFLLTTTPGLLNAMHITLYVFISDTPPFMCRPPAPLDGWSLEQIRNITSPGGLSSRESCSIYAWNYTELASLGYEGALSLTSSLPLPEVVPCSGYLYEEDIEKHSVVSEWDLVCDREHLKSSVQVSVALGKFIGAFVFGIIADRIGRKKCFVIASVVYLLSGPAAAWVSSFVMFLVIRLLIGIAGSGVYETGYTLLTELTITKHRTRLSCIYGIFYPVGMVVLPVIASQFQSWRLIQLYISLPTVLILYNCWKLPESPRWLLVHGRREEASKILFGDRGPIELETFAQNELIKRENKKEEPNHVWYKKVINFLRSALKIFTHPELRNRAFICCFSWFVASLSYYAIALNANNLSGNRYIYVALNGLFEAPGYLLPIALLSYLGRKSGSTVAFFSSGLALLSIIVIPKDSAILVMAAAMAGRFCISSVFSVITLHTSELFPTTDRNTAFGLSLTMSQVGSIGAPYVVDVLGKKGWFIPSTVCGSLSVIAGTLILLLPETKDRTLLDTVQEVDSSSERVSILNCCAFK